MEKNILNKRFYILTLILIFFVTTGKSEQPKFKSTNTPYLILNFIENKGQLPDSVLFACEYDGGFFYFFKNGFIVNQLESTHHRHGGNADTNSIIKGHNYKVNFKLSNENVDIIPQKKAITIFNYILKNENKEINASCNAFKSLLYKNIYKNIDIHFFAHNNELKYDIIVHPGGDLNDVQLEYFGIEKISLKKNELFYETSLKSINEKIPLAFVQEEDGTKNNIQVEYKLNQNIVSYAIKGEYDITKTLIIDPSLVFASFSGSNTDNWGFTATYGKDSSFYLGGIVYQTGFNNTIGAFQVSFGGGNANSSTFLNNARPLDVVITKLNANGNAILYATYLGGTGDDLPNSLIEDKDGNLIILGRTNSRTNFPSSNRSTLGSLGKNDVFITKLNATGSGVIKTWIIGGTEDDGINLYANSSSQEMTATHRFYSDMSRSEVILDADNNLYIATQTKSNNFPTVSPFQSTFGGIQDAVFIKINASMNTILCSSYLGGTDIDAALTLTISKKTNDIFIAGSTLSSDFPGDKTNVIKNIKTGIDGFICKLNNTSTISIAKTTFIGTSSDDFIYGIKSDLKGFIYIMGVTDGEWVPINSPYNPGFGKQYFGKIDPDLSQWIYSTRFGTNSTFPNIAPIAFMVDKCERIYIGGFGKIYPYRVTKYDSKISGTSGLPITSDAIQSTTDNGDFYFIVFEKNALKILYSTFYGIITSRTNIDGSGDHTDGGTSRFDENGIIYAAICASCSENAIYPTTANAAFRTKPRTASCNMLGIKIDFELSGIDSKISSEFLGGKNRPVVCKGAPIKFIDEIGKGEKYFWLFGDGTPQVETTSPIIEHTFLSNGNFNVRLISYLSTSCNETDTSYIPVNVDDKFVKLNFVFERDSILCNELKVNFTNKSTSDQFSIENATFTWDFGDGNQVSSKDIHISHTYQQAGTYLVKLITKDIYCNQEEQITISLTVNVNAQAKFEIKDTICVNSQEKLKNFSSKSESYEWYLNNILISKEYEPTYLFTKEGQSTIKLIVKDPLSCNKIDSFQKYIYVLTQPESQFKIEFKTGFEGNEIPQFTNLSNNALEYKWDFGDSTTLMTQKIDTTLYHLFPQSKKYNVCLTVKNKYCEHTSCQVIDLTVKPKIIAPNAFTPNKDNVNDKFFLKIIGVKAFQLKIINRWGLVVFNTTNIEEGWDGTYQGQIQEPDTYTYIVDYETFDGKKLNTKGFLMLLK